MGATANPPSDAMRRGTSRGMFVGTVVVVAIIMLVAGVFVGKMIYGTSSSKPAYLVVGTNIPFPPFEDYNYSTGQYSGFDIDFAQMVANATGRTMVIQNYADFGVLLSTVGAGGVDMAASAITESGTSGANRNQTMSFSINYYQANQAVLVKSTSTLACAASVCTAADLKTLIVGVQSATTSQDWADANLVPLMANPGTQYQKFTTVDTEITALGAGSLDAVIIDSGPALGISDASGGSLKVAGAIITGELYGFAVAKGDPEGLLAVINNVITQSHQDGTYDKLIHKWFG